MLYHEGTKVICEGAKVICDGVTDTLSILKWLKRRCNEAIDDFVIATAVETSAV